MFYEFGNLLRSERPLLDFASNSNNRADILMAPAVRSCSVSPQRYRDAIRDGLAKEQTEKQPSEQDLIDEAYRRAWKNMKARREDLL